MRARQVVSQTQQLLRGPFYPGQNRQDVSLPDPAARRDCPCLRSISRQIGANPSQILSFTGRARSLLPEPTVEGFGVQREFLPVFGIMAENKLQQRRVQIEDVGLEIIRDPETLDADTAEMSA